MYCDTRLSCLSQLISLMLSAFNLHSGMFSALSALTQLKSLDISRASVFSYGAMVPHNIVCGLTSNLTQLTNLDLSYTSRSHFDPQSLGKLVSSLPQLKRLRLEGVEIPAGLLSQLPERVEVPAIDLVLTEGSRSQAEGWLRRSGKVMEALTIKCATPLGGAALQPLFALLKPIYAPRLQSLCLKNCDIWGHCSVLGELTQMTELCFCSCSMQSADLISLSGLIGLHDLHFGAGAHFDCSQESMDCLANGLRHLTTLFVGAGGCRVVAAAKEAFKERILCCDGGLLLTLKPSE